MAMATAAAMAGTALHTPSLHVARPSAACPGLSSRTSVAFSGYNGAALKANSAVGRSVFSNSRRLCVKAAMEVDVGKIVPQADRVLIRLEALQAKSAGGVLLPSAAVKYDRYLQGEIIATGSEVSEVQKGQKVMFADINAYEVNFGTSDRLCFCRGGDLDTQEHHLLQNIANIPRNNLNLKETIGNTVLCRCAGKVSATWLAIVAIGLLVLCVIMNVVRVLGMRELNHQRAHFWSHCVEVPRRKWNASETKMEFSVKGMPLMWKEALPKKLLSTLRT